MQNEKAHFLVILYAVKIQNMQSCFAAIFQCCKNAKSASMFSRDFFQCFKNAKAVSTFYMISFDAVKMQNRNDIFS